MCSRPTSRQPLAPAEVADRSPASPASTSTSSAQSSVVLVSHTPDLESSTPASDTPSTSSSRSSRVVREASQPGQPPPDPQGWESWVKSYAEGAWSPDSGVPPEVPDAISAVLDRPEGSRPDAELHLFPSAASELDGGVKSLTSPAMLLEFYRENGYYPAPKGEFEEERLATMSRYGLDDPVRRRAVDRICNVAKTYFRTSTVIITLVFENHQVLAAERGWVDSDPGLDVPCRPTPYDSSFCAHNMTQLDPSTTFNYPDAQKDWRFKSNPHTVPAGGGLASYAAANIHLPTSGSANANFPASLPVGSLCIIDNRPRAADGLSDEDKGILHDLAEMTAREFELGFEAKRRQTEQLQTKFLSNFLDSTLVHTPPVQAPENSFSRESSTTSIQLASTSPRPTSPTVPIRDRPQLASPSASTTSHKSSATTSTLSAYNSATEQIRTLTAAHSAAILDLRQLRTPPSKPGTAPPSPTARRTASVADQFRVGGGSVFLLGSSGDVDWENVLVEKQDQVGRVVCDAISLYYENGSTEFDGVTRLNPLQGILPHATTGSLAVPVFDVAGRPALLLVLTSSEKRFRFESADRVFVQSVGGVFMASLLRQQAIEADRAKLAFVSQISHELRTPLHGINSQAELIREFSSPSQLFKLSPLLDVMDCCLEALKDVLDDTIDFTKLSNTSAAETEAAHKRSLTAGDLEELCEATIKTGDAEPETVQATWVKKRRVDLVNIDTHPVNSSSGTKFQNVDVILEVEDRKDGWNAMIDRGGLKRCLLNLLGNALKFTTEGHVKVKLSCQPRPFSDEDTRHVALISIEDTGCGMSEEFQRNGGLFLPFAQEDPFALGTGLGMSIVQSIVRRMGGKIEVASVLGQGTTVRVLVPIAFIPSPSSSPDIAFVTPAFERPASFPQPSFRSRVISDELRSLFTPGPSHIFSTPLCDEQQGGFDFSNAVEAAQASVGVGKLGRIPSFTSKRPAVLGSSIDLSGLAVEGAKLGMGTLPPLPRRPSPRSSAQSSDSSTSTARDPQSRSPLIGSPPGKASFAPDVRVLIADDNSIARNILTKLFSGKGIAFDTAADGQQAVDAYKANCARINLLLLDVQMPNKDGIEAAAEIRMWEEKMGLPRRRIVALTGLSGEGDMQRAGVVEGGPAGPIDHWLCKGGRSLRLILEEVSLVQTELKLDESPGS